MLVRLNDYIVDTSTIREVFLEYKSQKYYPETTVLIVFKDQSRQELAGKTSERVREWFQQHISNEI